MTAHSAFLFTSLKFGKIKEATKLQHTHTHRWQFQISVLEMRCKPTHSPAHTRTHAHKRTHRHSCKIAAPKQYGFLLRFQTIEAKFKHRKLKEMNELTPSKASNLETDT